MIVWAMFVGSEHEKQPGRDARHQAIRCFPVASRVALGLFLCRALSGSIGCPGDGFLAASSMEALLEH